MRAALYGSTATIDARGMKRALILGLLLGLVVVVLAAFL